MSNPGFFYGAQHTNITGSQMNDVGHDQYNTTITNIKNLSLTVPQQENTLIMSFNDAPVDLLSIHFAGRDQELYTIKQLFESIQDDVPSRCAIYGMPGIGKTQLALQYAKLSYQQKQYTYVFWISGATIEKLNQGFVKLLNLVSHPERNNPEQDARLVAARRWLEDCSATSWLVVFDNVSRDTLGFLREHVPRKNVRGNILYTTRTEDVAKAVVNAAGQQQHILELHVLDIKDAASLFFQNAEIDEEDISSSSVVGDAESLVKRIGRLPLAIVHAASFMRESALTLSELLELYESAENKMEILNWENDLTPYEQASIVAMFKSILERLSPEVRHVLNILSFYDPESIAISMIVGGAKAYIQVKSKSQLEAAPTSNTTQSDDQTDLVLQSQTDDTVDEPDSGEIADLIYDPVWNSLVDLVRSPVQLAKAIQQLQSLSIVQKRSNDGIRTLHIHDLFNFMVRETLVAEGSWLEWFNRAVILICGAFHVVEDYESYKCWPQCAMFSSHMQSLLSLQDVYGVDSLQLANASTALAGYMKSQGRYDEAEIICSKAVTMLQSHLEPTDRFVLHAIQALADIFLGKGKYDEAEQLLRNIVACAEELGPEHPLIPGSESILARVYLSQGQYTKAEKFFVKLLAINQKKFGEDHPQTLRKMHNLATVFQYQGKFIEAEAMYEKVLIGRAKLGEDEDLSRLTTMQNLAMMLKSQGQLGKAERWLKESLEGTEKIIGAEHPDTLIIVHNLAGLYKSQGKYDEAGELYQKVKVGQEKQLGSEHPHTLKTMYNIATVHEFQGQYSEAEGLYREALSAQEKHLGPDHHHTLATVHSLAYVCRKKGQFNEAEALYKRALKGLEEQLGREHSETLATVHDLALLYSSQEQYSEAKALLTRALEGHEKKFGTEHPGTLAIMCSMASLYQSQNQYTEAELLYSKILEKEERYLGTDHPSTLATMHNLAMLYDKQEQYSKAENLYSKLLPGMKKCFGPEHPNTLETVSNLAMAYELQGEYNKAKKMYTQALVASQKIYGGEHSRTLAIQSQLTKCGMENICT